MNSSLSFVMDKENCDVTIDLEDLGRIINRFTPLGKPSKRYEYATVEYLYEAVVGN